MKGTEDASSSSEVMLDSLPYVETVHEDYEEYALALIEDEMKEIAPRPIKKIAPIKFRTPIMQTEYETLVVKGESEDGGDAPEVIRKRPKEHLQQFQPKKIKKPTTFEEWEKDSKSSNDVLSQMRRRYEAERIRGLVLAAEKAEGVAMWKDYCTSLDEIAEFWKKMLEKEIEAKEEINFRRQELQTQQFGPEIDRLSQEYQQVLYRRNQLQHAIEGMKRKREITSSTDKSRKRKVDT